VLSWDDKTNFNPLDVGLTGRILHDISFYLFSIICFALLLQWFWTYEILNDPVKAVEHQDTSFYTKVLSGSLLASLLLLVFAILFDCLGNNGIAAWLGLFLNLWLVFVLICYIVLYVKFLLLMRRSPEFLVL
jgi:hypothetical protein